MSDGDIEFERIKRACRRYSALCIRSSYALCGPQELTELTLRQRLITKFAHRPPPRDAAFKRDAAVLVRLRELHTLSLVEHIRTVVGIVDASNTCWPSTQPFLTTIFFRPFCASAAFGRASPELQKQIPFCTLRVNWCGELCVPNQPGPGSVRTISLKRSHSVAVQISVWA